MVKSRFTTASAIIGTSLLGAAAGGVAIKTVLTGRSRRQADGDDAPARAARSRSDDCVTEGRTVTIARPRQELFAFWRDFKNLPGFMENIEKVAFTGDNGRAAWTIKAPAGRSVDIETEIVEEVEGKLIAWRSLPGSDVETEGRVVFEDAPGTRGTRVSAIIDYKPPAGAVGLAMAKMFLREPEIQARHDLKRFKMLMETGEIATSASRPENRRAAKQAEKSKQKEEA